MKVRYDAEVDILYIRLTEEVIANSEEVKAGIIMDYDASGKLVGIEVLDASACNLGVNPEKSSLIEVSLALAA